MVALGFGWREAVYVRQRFKVCKITANFVLLKKYKSIVQVNAKIEFCDFKWD